MAILLHTLIRNSIRLTNVVPIQPLVRDKGFEPLRQIWKIRRLAINLNLACEYIIANCWMLCKLPLWISGISDMSTQDSQVGEVGESGEALEQCKDQYREVDSGDRNVDNIHNEDKRDSHLGEVCNSTSY